MKNVSDNDPYWNQHDYDDSQRAAFQYAPPLLALLLAEHQLLNAKQGDVGDENHQYVVVLDGFEEPPVHESMEEPLHAAP